MLVPNGGLKTVVIISQYVLTKILGFLCQFLHLHRENGQAHAEDPVGQLDPGAGAAAAAASSDLRLEQEQTLFNDLRH